MSSKSSDSKKQQQQQQQQQKCGECETRYADGNCESCRVKYCCQCFSTIHKNSKVLKTHVLENFDDKKRNQSNLSINIKDRHCYIHKRPCQNYCPKCDATICIECAMQGHNHHGYITIAEENKKHSDELFSFLQAMNATRQTVNASQKELKSSANYLKECAAETILQINDYFLELHSFLQLEEQKILKHFAEICQGPQRKINEAFLTLHNTQESLDKLKCQLETYAKKPPTRFHIYEVISSASEKLERLPCKLEISKFLTNPYIFEPRKDSKLEIRKLYSFMANNSNFHLSLNPIYVDIKKHQRPPIPSLNSEIFDDQTDLASATSSFGMQSTNGPQDALMKSIIKPISSCARATQKMYSQPPEDYEMRSMPSHSGKQPLIARVSHIVNPDNFYVQLQCNLPLIRTISERYVQSSLSQVAKTIKEGALYMIYHINDGLWYRAMIKRSLNNDAFKIFLQDFGSEIDIPRNSIYEISDEVRAITPIAKQCSLAYIMPANADNTWNEEARLLMREIIENKTVQVLIYEEVNRNSWKVDIYTTHTTEPISVQDSFLYTGLARLKPNIEGFVGMTKPMAKMKQRLKKQFLTEGTSFRTKIVHIENPQEFYAIKMDQYPLKMELCDQLNHHYSNNKKNKKIFLAYKHTACAAFISQKWHRACVEEVLGQGKVRVHLVDEGNFETVDWSQLYELESNFLEHKEFTFECCLCDVEPLQKNNYTWTDEAIAFFTQITKNPCLQVTIYSFNEKSLVYNVTLHIIRKDADRNVGALLVKYNHGLSTGERSSISDLPTSNSDTQRSSLKRGKNPINADTSLAAINDIPKKKVLKRTAIKIAHIETPSEFYVQMVDFLAGIRDFHAELQKAQAEIQAETASETEYNKEWNIGDHCLVRTSNSKSTVGRPYLEWFRGIIKAIDKNPDNDRPYVVFLRDEGRVIHSIREEHLATISPIFDRVANASHLCHLACIKPTGGLNEWSKTTIERFKHYTTLFESLSATKQGNTINGSIPIILWGLQTETIDPLAPSITRYTSINQTLANSGLAHLTEKIDLDALIDSQFNIETGEEGEQTLADWFADFSNKIKPISEFAANDNKFDFNDNDYDADNYIPNYSRELDLDSDAVTDVLIGGWLPSKLITKSLFTAYATYVDYDGLIHIHDAEIHSFLDRMSTKINETFGETLATKGMEGEFCVGRPCLARYHLDNKFYRATISNIRSDRTFEVRFIDYGNVEICHLNELRMLTPFPHVPTLSNKIQIDGIRPKYGDSSYTTPVLDKIHSYVVGKMISVRVIGSDIKKHIKRCSIRVNDEDLATILISSGLVSAATYEATLRSQRFHNPVASIDLDLSPIEHDDDPYFDEIDEMQTKFRLIDDIDEKTIDNNNRLDDNIAVRDDNITPEQDEVQKKSSPLLSQKTTKNKKKIDSISKKSIIYEDDSIMNYENGDDGNANDDVDIDVDRTLQQQQQKQQSDESNLGENKKLSKEAIGYKKLFEKLQFKPVDLIKARIQNKQKNATSVNCSFSQDNDDDDDFDEEGAVGGGGGGGHIDNNNVDAMSDINTDLDDFSNDECDDNQKDVIELEQSFRNNYWLNDDDDDRQSSRYSLKLTARPTENEADDILSEFDSFVPQDASSSITHFSGIESFRSPTLPPGVESFYCDIVFIRSTTLIHIFPHLSELEYREQELERNCQLAAKKATPLHKFEVRTICLARYSVDKLWYRAVIRSYNVAGKQVDVMYVDFLNTETIPISDVRKCPANLIGMPLRTFAVKLYGMKPNLQMNSMKTIKMQLRKCIGDRVLYGRLMRRDESEPPEIILFDTKTSKKSICEDLITKQYYTRG